MQNFSQHRVLSNHHRHNVDDLRCSFLPFSLQRNVFMALLRLLRFCIIHCSTLSSHFTADNSLQSINMFAQSFNFIDDLVNLSNCFAAQCWRSACQLWWCDEKISRIEWDASLPSTHLSACLSFHASVSHSKDRSEKLKTPSLKCCRWKSSKWRRCKIVMLALVNNNRRARHWNNVKWAIAEDAEEWVSKAYNASRKLLIIIDEWK